MKPAPTLAAILALVSLPLYSQTRDEKLIRTVKEIPAKAIEPTLSGGDGSAPFERYLANVTRVPVAAIKWAVNDCGEGGDGRKAPTCVEARAELAPGTTLGVSVSVLGTDGNPGAPGLFMAYVTKGSRTTFANSMRELLQLVASTK